MPRTPTCSSTPPFWPGRRRWRTSCRPASPPSSSWARRRRSRPIARCATGSRCWRRRISSLASRQATLAGARRARCLLALLHLGHDGRSEGVLYSHRSTVIHAISTLQKDCFNIGAADVVMPVVPMFHVNGWGIPYSTAAAGASLVLPGPKLDPASLHRLIEEEGVTFSAGVPTIWTALLNWMRAEPARRFSAPPRLVVGGTALPTAINAGFLKEYGVSILHAWGMTEMSPLGTTNRASRRMRIGMPTASSTTPASRGGRCSAWRSGCATARKEIPHDGVAFGELEVRGPWVASAYFNRPGDPAHTPDGWFRTGDVVTVDALGCIEIVDRAKDVIKSGGEWISSITLENLIMGHPAVAEAAVIAIRHPKWDERPLLLVQPKPGTAPTAEEILHFYEGKVAKWWIPDQVEFVESLPHTATGKLWKAELKQRYKDRLAG
ncbi:AMP-binding protein [Siccirubricoccus deserti]